MATKQKQIKLTSEETADLTRLARLLAESKRDNIEIRDLGHKYKDFVEKHFDELIETVKVGNLKLSLQISRKLVVEEIS